MADLPTAVLGRTGLRVTRMGIGGAYCKDPDVYRAALDCGVTYVDTARIYHDGDDERIIGEAIAGRRQGLVLATKTRKADAVGAREDLETSLRLLRTDYLDIWQMHYLNDATEREQFLGPGGALEAAVKAREQGLVRFIGVTGHVWSEVAQSVATGQFDTVLCWYNAAQRDPEQQLFPLAQAHTMGVIIMRTTGLDKLLAAPDAPPPELFYRYVLAHPDVHVALMGLRDLDRFRRVSPALSDSLALSDRERDSLEAYGARMMPALAE
jgi:uncharacterized protein